jgi:hypothetical protein
MKRTKKPSTTETTPPTIKKPEPELYGQVARMAYDLFVRRGGVHGHDVDDWIEAERRVKTEPTP